MNRSGDRHDYDPSIVQTDLDRLLQSSESLANSQRNTGYVPGASTDEAQGVLHQLGINMDEQWKMLKSIGFYNTSVGNNLTVIQQTTPKKEQGMGSLTSARDVTQLLVEQENSMVLKEMDRAALKSEKELWEKETEDQLQSYQSPVGTNFSEGTENGLCQLYAKEIAELDIDLRKGNRVFVCDQLSRIYDDINLPKTLGSSAKSLDRVSSKQIWKLTSSFLDEKHSDMKSFLEKYSDKDTAEGQAACRQSLIDSSLVHLTDSFSSSMSSTLHEWRFSSTPDHLGKLKAFVQRSVRNRTDPEDLHLLGPLLAYEEPFWPMVFYCFRTGKKHSLQNLLSQAERDPHLESISMRVSRLAALVEETHDQNLVIRPSALSAAEFRQLFENVQDDYRIHVSGSSNPFEVAVYLLVSLAESFTDISYFLQRPERVSAFTHFITPTMDDYLWFRLKLTREFPEPSWLYDQFDLSHETFNMNSLQQSLLSYLQQDYFESEQRPVLFFQLLIFSQFFNQALQFIQRLDPILGIHLSLVFQMYGLTQLDTQLTLMDQEPIRFHLLLDSYLGQYHKKQPKTAFRYLDVMNVSLRHSLHRPSALGELQMLVFKLIERCSNEDLQLLLGSSGALLPSSFENIVVDAARYFEHISRMDKAFVLYSRFIPFRECGSKACCMAISSFGNVLEWVAKSVGTRVDPGTSAEIFTSFRERINELEQLGMISFIQHVVSEQSVASGSRDETLFSSLQTCWALYLFYKELLEGNYENARHFIFDGIVPPLEKSLSSQEMVRHVRSRDYGSHLTRLLSLFLEQAQWIIQRTDSHSQADKLARHLRAFRDNLLAYGVISVQV